jgi:hypothetical protein
MDEEQLIEMIIQTKEWYDKKVAQLEQVSNSRDYKIKFQGEDGNQTELPEEYRKGFHIGVLTALEILGKFPINISNQPEEEE